MARVPTHGDDMITLETERLRIRNFTTNDGPAFREVILNYQASESAKFEPPWPTSPDEVQGIVQWFASGDDYLCVCLKDSGTVIGMLAIERRKESEAHVRNLGYIFHPAYQGYGYAQESGRAMMRYIFTQLASEAIHTGTNPANTASVRLLTRLGLRQVSDGEFVLSRAEWLASNAGAPL